MVFIKVRRRGRCDLRSGGGRRWAIGPVRLAPMTEHDAGEVNLHKLHNKVYRTYHRQRADRSNMVKQVCLPRHVADDLDVSAPALPAFDAGSGFL